MKKRFLMTMFSLFTIGAAATTTLTLTSCSSANPSRAIKVNEFTMDLFNGDQKQHKINIKNVNKEVNIDPTNLIYGTNAVNGGKYMFIYGTVGRINAHLVNNAPDGSEFVNIHLDKGAPSPFYEWLTETQQSKDEVDFYQNFEIGNTFFDAWFNDNPETKSQYKDVKIYTYIDIPPVLQSTANPGTTEDLDRVLMVDPYSTYTSDDVLNLYRWSAQKNGDFPGLNFDELPVNWKMLSGTYMRQDESAIQYRRLVDYVEKVRPTLSPVNGSDMKNNGMICFNTTAKSPFTGLLDKASVGNIGQGSGATLLTNFGSSWKSIYHLFRGKPLEEFGDQQNNDQSNGESQSQ